MAVKIKLTRLGKIRNPQYRIAIADARNRRDGRSIEVIGRYHPKEEPSLIEIDSERAQYWLSVGAQPTEPVLKLLKITGDWQKFKGLPGAEGTLEVKEARPSKVIAFEAAVKAAGEAPKTKPKPKLVVEEPAAVDVVTAEVAAADETVAEAVAEEAAAEMVAADEAAVEAIEQAADEAAAEAAEEQA
ncbi:MAG TPA: 30S ribosomal protein S16 [Actinobacteria bacterium]|nr:30S ribosomal protein S16 [Actinomycetota bacterium]